MTSRADRDLKDFESSAPKWYRTYQRVTAYPFFVLSLMFIAGFSISVVGSDNPDDERFAQIIIPFTWVVFAIDFVIGLLLARHKLRFVRSHWAQGLALLFPPLRILMLVHTFSVVKNSTLARGDKARTYLLFITTLVGFISAVLVVYFERQVPDSNIRSLGNAIWWVGETVSTVGYGDYYPVTIGGRIVAGVLFVNGVALLSVITAGLAQRYTAPTQSSGPSAAQGTAGQVADTGNAAADAPAGSPSSDPHGAAATPTDPHGAAATPTDDAGTVMVSRSELNAMRSRLSELEQHVQGMGARLTDLLHPADARPSNEQSGADTLTVDDSPRHAAGGPEGDGPSS